MFVIVLVNAWDGAQIEEVIGPFPAEENAEGRCRR